VEPAGEESSTIPLPLPVKRGRGRPRRNPNITIFLQNDAQFQASRQLEVLGLLEKGVFKVASNVLKGIRIFNSRFINKVKNKGTKKAFMKLRLMV
jgi:hypothetical protein